MNIKKITVKRFRAIKEKTVEFSPGLNVIKGSGNEAGKSSLRMSITKALYQDTTTSRRDVQELTSWGTDEPWEVSLEFEADALYRITRSLKDKTAELVCMGAHEFVAQNKNTIAEKIAELTGCPSEVFYESTACLGQEALIRIIPEGQEKDAVGTITKRLEAQLSGAEGVDVLEILARLYAKTHHKDAAGPYRHLQDIAGRIGGLRGQRLSQEEKVNDILEKRRVLLRAREELEKIQKELPAQRQLLDKNRKTLELQKDIAREKAQYERFQTAKEHRARLAEMEQGLAALAAFVDDAGAKNKVDVARNQKENLRQQHIALAEELKVLQGQKPAAWLLGLGLALIVGGVAGLVATPLFLAVSVVGLLAGAYWGITYRGWRRQVTAAAGKASGLEQQVEESHQKLQQVLKEFGCTDAEDFDRRLAEYRAKAEERKAVRHRLEALLAGKEWEPFAAENADLDIRIRANLKELEQLGPFKLEPLAMQELEEKVNAGLNRQARLEQETGALEKFFEYTDADKDQLTETEEELFRLEQQKEFWERKKKVFELVRETLEQAYKQTLSRAADLLETEISRYMAIITEGRYGRVKIGENNLSIRTFSPEKNDWVEVTKLSRATQDQFHICARLALVKLITEGKRPPILLDDPFVNYHSQRLRKMMALLQEIAKESQILLFTCSDSYDYLGNIILVDQ